MNTFFAALVHLNLYRKYIHLKKTWLYPTNTESLGLKEILVLFNKDAATQKLGSCPLFQNFVHGCAQLYPVFSVNFAEIFSQAQLVLIDWLNF